MKEELAAGTFPGVVLLVAHRRYILFHQAFGYATLTPATEPMTVDTLFDLASLTKVIATTTALMLLYAQRIFALDDRVSDFLPDFGRQGKEQVTIRHLLTHSSGLPAWAPLYEVFSPFERADRRAEYYQTISQMALVTPPGMHSRYSDLGFIMLGALIEILSGKPLEAFCHETIFGPLQLKSLHFSQSKDISPFPLHRYAATEHCSWRKRVLRGEVHDENAYAMGGVAGHAGLFSTAEDLYRFLLAFLPSVQPSSSPFISPETFREFTSRQELPPGSTWCLGWDTPSLQGSTAGRYFSPQSIGHTGFTGTSLWIDLEREVMVICLTNRVHPSRHHSDLKQFRPRLHNCIMETLL